MGDGDLQYYNDFNDGLPALLSISSQNKNHSNHLLSRDPTLVQGFACPVSLHHMIDPKYAFGGGENDGSGHDNLPGNNYSREMFGTPTHQVREEVLPGSCCFHRGKTLQPGFRIPLPSKCSWLVSGGDGGDNNQI